MKSGLFIIPLLLTLIFGVSATHAQTPVFALGEADPLEADFVNRHSFVDSPVARGGMAVSAEFVFTYQGVPPAVQAAAQRAAMIWSTHIVSPVPIKVLVDWVPFEGSVLGAAAPRLIANFSGAPDWNTFFPTALASAVVGYDVSTDEADIHIQLNSAFEHWYFGTDDAPPEDTFDMVTVILHEIGHGLGFVGSMYFAGGVGGWGRGASLVPMVYDRFAETSFTGSLVSLIDSFTFPNPSGLLGHVLQSGTLYLGGTASVAAHVDSQEAQGLGIGPFQRPKLHAPEEWRAGSSYSHLTEETLGEGDDEYQPYYPPGSLNSLMTPRLAATEVIRTPGPITCGLLQDMGWSLGDHCLALLPGIQPPDDDSFIVSGPCPNPTRAGVVRVRVHVQETTFVDAEVYDVLGRRVRRLYQARILPSAPTSDPYCGPGQGTIAVDTSSLASGVYFLRLIIGNRQETVRFTVVH